MGGRWLAVGLALGLLFSACIEPKSKAATAGPVADLVPPYDATLPLHVAFNMTGCLEVAVGVLVDFTKAQQSLPVGFKAGDAQALLGLPVPTQRALVALTTATCASSDFDASGFNEASTAITIQSPKVPGQRTAAVDLYELARGTSTPNHTELLGAIGWNQVGTLVTNKMAMTQTNGVPTGVSAGSA